MRRVRLSPAYRLLIVFSLTIVAPGLILAFFGARGLWQERQAAGRRLAERLEHSAGLALESLSEQLARLQAGVDGRVWSDGSRIEWPDDGSWAFVAREGEGLRVHPATVLPFELWAPERDPFETADTPAAATHREARRLKAAGRTGDAIRLWRDLEARGGTIGALPADLVAGFELARLEGAHAQAFYDRLSGGRWRIDRARYLFYSAEVIDRVTVSARELTALRLSDALEAVVAGQRVVSSEAGGLHVAFRRDDPFSALVVSDRFLAARVPPAADAAARVMRITADGHVVAGAPARAETGPRATRHLSAGGISWAIDVEPADASGFAAGWIRQSNLYLAMLGMVLALLGSGGYLIARTVRREVQVARLKSDFVSTVSHEFRSPLTGIRQLAEMLTRDRVLDEARRRQYYGLILHESERMGRLVESVLDFARMEDGRKPYRREPLETTAWLRGVAGEFAREAARAGFTLEASIPDGLPALTGDREALSTAVRNLLDNAVKYSPGGTTIWLDACAGDGLLRIRVRDEGVGIAARDHPHIFEKFYRVDGDLAQTVKGVGLGLSLVQHIVRAHNGRVLVESAEGRGSTFSIELAGAA